MHQPSISELVFCRMSDTPRRPRWVRWWRCQ